MGLSISQNMAPQPPIFIQEQAILAEEVFAPEQAFMPEEFETARIMARNEVERAIGDDTGGLKKDLSEKIELTIQASIPAFTTPVKNCILRTTPTFGPLINISIDVCVEPAAKKIAKLAADKCVDNGVKPALNSCIDKSTKVAQKCAHKTKDSTQSILSWAGSFIK